MSLGVQSYPELYTTLIGWNLYDQLWTLLKETGLAFLPFIGLIIRHMAKPYESQETKDAATTSLRRIEVDIIAIILFITFAVSPWIPLAPAAVSYSPSCPVNGQSSTVTPGHTQTTWDSAFTVPSEAITVPIWWYAVMAFSEGMTSAANASLSCVPNLRQLVSEVNMTAITDPVLKQELQQFEQQCYIPARTKYFQDTQTSNPTLQTITNDRSQYGTDDTEWLGSHGFQETYYQHLNASQPVPGFPYDASQDINADVDQDNPPAFGTPNCYDWWNDSENGLKSRVFKQLSPDITNNLNSYFTSGGKTEQLQDNVLKTVLTNNDNGYQNPSNPNDSISYSSLVTELGSWVSALSTYPKLYAAAQAAPIIQSLLLLMVYAFLPFALVFNSYRIGSFLAGSLIIFSLIFWSFIWHLVSYVDSTLINALYTDNWFSHQSPSATLADMITGTLIIVAPLFWFSFMGAMGVALGDVITRAFSNMNDVSNKAAEDGVKAAKAATSYASNVLTKLK